MWKLNYGSGIERYTQIGEPFRWLAYAGLLTMALAIVVFWEE